MNAMNAEKRQMRANTSGQLISIQKEKQKRVYRLLQKEKDFGQDDLAVIMDVNRSTIF